MRAAILIVFLPLICVLAFYSWQYDWSDGPGVAGPVSFYWLNTFSSHIQIEWENVPEVSEEVREAADKFFETAEKIEKGEIDLDSLNMNFEKEIEAEEPPEKTE